MTDLQDLFETVEHLPDDDKIELLKHLQRLIKPSQDKPRQRILDLHKGMVVIADDFDDELPDSFWFGES